MVSHLCALVPPLNHLMQDIIEKDIWLDSSFQKSCLAASIISVPPQKEQKKICSVVEMHVVCYINT